MSSDVGRLQKFSKKNIPSSSRRFLKRKVKSAGPINSWKWSRGWKQRWEQGGYIQFGYECLMKWQTSLSLFPLLGFLFGFFTFSLFPGPGHFIFAFSFYGLSLLPPSIFPSSRMFLMLSASIVVVICAGAVHWFSVSIVLSGCRRYVCVRFIFFIFYFLFVLVQPL